MKRERRKQSNRESARRSRLRKQVLSSVRVIINDTEREWRWLYSIGLFPFYFAGDALIINGATSKA